MAGRLLDRLKRVSSDLGRLCGEFPGSYLLGTLAACTSTHVLDIRTQLRTRSVLMHLLLLLILVPCNMLLVDARSSWHTPCILVNGRRQSPAPPAPSRLPGPRPKLGRILGGPLPPSPCSCPPPQQSAHPRTMMDDCGGGGGGSGSGYGIGGLSALSTAHVLGTSLG